MGQRPTIYGDLSRSICPSVYGHDAIKQAILLMLFGGVHKRTLEARAARASTPPAAPRPAACAARLLVAKTPARAHTLHAPRPLRRAPTCAATSTWPSSATPPAPRASCSSTWPPSCRARCTRAARPPPRRV